LDEENLSNLIKCDKKVNPNIIQWPTIGMKKEIAGKGKILTQENGY